VLLTDGAARDLDELFAWQYDQGPSDSVDLLLDQIQSAIKALSEGREIGVPIPSLLQMGVKDTRQYLTDTWRMVYQANLDEVHIIAFAQDQRSYQALLQRRLVDA